MKRLFILALVLLPFGAAAQDIAVKTASPVPVAAVQEVLPAYDSTVLYMSLRSLVDNPKFYDGQKIMLLPCDGTSGDRLYTHLSGFHVRGERPLPQYADTVWNSRRTKVKDVFVPSSDVYAPEGVAGARVLDIGGSVRLQDGFCTPASAVEGRFFTVERVVVTKDASEGGRFEFLFEMADADGVPVDWTFSWSLLYDIPVLVYAGYGRMRDSHVGRTYIVDPEKRYHNYAARSLGAQKYDVVTGGLLCTEFSLAPGTRFRRFILSWAGADGGGYVTYLEPHLFFRDSLGREYPVVAHEGGGDYNPVSPSQVAGGSYSEMYRELTLASLVDLQEYSDLQERKRIKAEEELAERMRLKAEKEAEEARQKEARLQYLTKKYGASAAKDMMAGLVRLGWNAERCRESWGVPDHINRTSGVWGIREQWVYGDSNYLYFDNGVLTSIQN